MIIRWLLTPIFLVVFHSANSDVLTIRADAWYPMNGDPYAPNPGYMIDLAKAILEPEGYDVQYRISPWNRAIHNALQGNIDCVVGATADEAEGLLLPKHSWGIASSGVYVKANDSWRFRNKEELLQRRTGLVSGYEYGNGLDKFFSLHSGRIFQFIAGNDPVKHNINKLLADKVNGVIETTSVMDAYLKANNLQDKVINAGAIGPSLPLYIACSKKFARTQKAIKLIDKAIPEMRDNGQLANILGTYGLTDWED